MKRNVAPTRSNLIKLKDELKFAELGYELLDQKRNILVIELLNLVDQAVEYETKVNASLETAYSSLRNSVLKMGKLKVGNLTGAINVENEIRLKERRVMGVRLPVVETDFQDSGSLFQPPGYQLSGRGSARQFQRVAEAYGQARGAEGSLLWRPRSGSKKNNQKGKRSRKDCHT